jgi:hypothetical protein
VCDTIGRKTKDEGRNIISRRKFLQDATLLRQAYRRAEVLVAKLHTMRKTIAPGQPWLREEAAAYVLDDEGQETNGN